MYRDYRLILASASPRRADLLRRMGFRFDILTGEVDEDDPDISDPGALTMALSRRKAESVLQHVKAGIVIGADTVVYWDGEIMGKPADLAEASGMLKKLSGQTHHVYTGFTLIQSEGMILSDVEETAVTFRNLDDWEIADYVQSGGPLDKAGAYGIQDRSGLFVDRIEGCFYNVVGFPLTKFFQGLKQMADVDTIRRFIGRQ